MLTMKASLRGAAVLPARKTTIKAPRGSLKVVALTDWKLQPVESWCKANEQECALLDKSYGLSGLISEKMKAAMTGSLPPEDQGRDDQSQFKVLCDKTGVNVAFESSDLSKPPTKLWMKDLGSTADIKVDDKPLEKNGTVELKPGSKVEFGKLPFQVQRNVHAHA